MTYYKVLVNGRSFHGGNCEYSLPTQREDGTWEPGDWMPEIQGPIVLCANGYHLTREPARWWRKGAECYVAEWDGEYVGDGGDKIAVRRCRLLRRLTEAELASLRVFVEGSHEVSDGIAWASGTAQVKAYGFAQVKAYDSARVKAFGYAQVKAYDYAQVDAYDSAQVEAYDLARVRSRDYAQVDAYDSAQVDAYDSAQIIASGSAQVKVYDSAKVKAYGTAQVEAYGTAQVEAYDSTRVWARKAAQVMAYDSAQIRASGAAQVKAYGSAQVEVYGHVQVEAYYSALVRTTLYDGGQPTVVTYDAAVWVDHRSGVPVVHTAEGRWEPVASGVEP